MIDTQEAATVPLHQWTHDGDRVLLVKCVAKGGVSHGGFQWPTQGRTRCPKAAADRDGAAGVTGRDLHDCQTGGLFGWAWGLNIGGGKEPEYEADWIVFASAPQDVVHLKDKEKAIGEVEILFYGSWSEALRITLPGRLAYIAANSRGSASATGDGGSASATGDGGSASATGPYGSASATGDGGSASATGDGGSASATGGHGSASATGSYGSASATGWSGSASATGSYGSASATGSYGSASATGLKGSASATGDGGTASATGSYGSASATGPTGSASATGWSGSASATGPGSVAALIARKGTVEVGPGGIGAVTAEAFTWIFRKGALLCCRWAKGGVWHHRLFVADEMPYADGDVVKISYGKIDGEEE